MVYERSGERPAGYLRIGELARRLAVSPELLRAWERRYGLLRPDRTAGGFRLYSDADETRVRAMQANLARGLSAAEAARLATGDGSAPVDMPRAGLESERVELEAALAALDGVGAHLALDRLLAVFSLDTVLREAVVPLLHDLGDRWARGEATVGEEHFASNLIRSRLTALARGWDQGVGPRALLACAPGEQHDLGLLCFGLAVRGRGWRISYLGADTPVATVEEVATAVGPDLVVIAAEMPDRLEPVSVELGRLAAAWPLAIGGRGATAELAALVGARHLDDDLVSAAERVARFRA